MSVGHPRDVATAAIPRTTTTAASPSLRTASRVIAVVVIVVGPAIGVAAVIVAAVIVAAIVVPAIVMATIVVATIAVAAPAATPTARAAALGYSRLHCRESQQGRAAQEQEVAAFNRFQADLRRLPLQAGGQTPPARSVLSWSSRPGPRTRG